jgi:tetratricopeptide (TPR) repeat protein
MIKFFRKIRYDLMGGNKTGTYFKYAFGEIVLVVIGILIALQINNWNENRKSDTIVKNYYNQILKDLAKDNDRIYSDLYYLESNIALHKDFVENLPTQKSPKAIIMSSAKLKHTTPSNTRFNANTIETLQTTGDIKLISPDIRNKLIELKNNQDIIYRGSIANYELFLKQLGNATTLGYNPNILLLDGLDKVPKQLYKDLKIEDNYSEIALAVVSSYFAKDLGEQDIFMRLKSIQDYTNSLFTIINEELGNPYKDIERVLSEFKSLNTLKHQGKTADEIIVLVKEQDRENPDYNISEISINELGYSYMNTLKNNSNALKVFKLNTELYPDAFSTHDSYGECLLLMGDTENAIKAYKKSLELNPRSVSAIKVLSELKVEN